MVAIVVIRDSKSKGWATTHQGLFIFFIVIASGAEQSLLSLKRLLRACGPRNDNKKPSTRKKGESWRTPLSPSEAVGAL